VRRFFSENSFWNQPIAANAPADPESTALLQFMSQQDDRGLWLNLDRWTIPIYEVNSHTPRRFVYRRFQAGGKGMIARSEAYIGPGHPMGHGAAFAADAEAGQIPIPDGAAADPERDSHIALVDWEGGWIWDMWAARRRQDGNWEANTGMKYRVDGCGVFDRKTFAVHNGESIHPYGPGRAAGVPILAGTIMHEEMMEGRIEHKLSFATQAAALQRFVYPPACWTDGGWLKGIPEGAVIQLDPALDISSLSLSPHARVVARALQEYGAVCVDVCGGHCLYAQGLYADPEQRTWTGVLASNDLIDIKLNHYRVLKMNCVVNEGQGPRVPDGMYA
jgi:hypothetical protein